MKKVKLYKKEIDFILNTIDAHKNFMLEHALYRDFKIYKRNANIILNKLLSKKE